MIGVINRSNQSTSIVLNNIENKYKCANQNRYNDTFSDSYCTSDMNHYVIV